MTDESVCFFLTEPMSSIIKGANQKLLLFWTEFKTPFLSCLSLSYIRHAASQPFLSSYSRLIYLFNWENHNKTGFYETDEIKISKPILQQFNHSFCVRLSI